MCVTVCYCVFLCKFIRCKFGFMSCVVCCTYDYAKVRQDISGTPWGNLFTFGTNFHRDSKMIWLHFGGQRLKVNAIVTAGLSMPFSWSRYLRNALRETLQISQKRQLAFWATIEKFKDWLLISYNDKKVMTFQTQKVIGELRWDIIMLCKNIFWPLFNPTTFSKPLSETYIL